MQDQTNGKKQVKEATYIGHASSARWQHITVMRLTKGERIDFIRRLPQV